MDALCNDCNTPCVEVPGQTLMLCPKCDALPAELEADYINGTNLTGRFPGNAAEAL